MQKNRRLFVFLKMCVSELEVSWLGRQLDWHFLIKTGAFQGGFPISLPQ
jgi:hypothetical protein